MIRHNIFYIHVKAGASSFPLISNILTKLNIWRLIGEKCEMQSIFPSSSIFTSNQKSV